MAELGPHIQVKAEALPEVAHQVDEGNFRQQVGKKMDVRVLGLIQVHVELY